MGKELPYYKQVRVASKESLLDNKAHPQNMQATGRGLHIGP